VSETKGALLSPCKTYRYSLRRRWGTGPNMAIVMLNPSTADANIDDPTIRKCRHFAERDGFGGLIVVNLFAFRATDQDVLWSMLKEGVDVVGPWNDESIRAALVETEGPVTCAWGRLPRGAFARETEVVELLDCSGRGVCCWGQNADGSPKHPLYLANGTPRLPFGCAE